MLTSGERIPEEWKYTLTFHYCFIAFKKSTKERQIVASAFRGDFVIFLIMGNAFESIHHFFSEGGWHSTPKNPAFKTFHLSTQKCGHPKSVATPEDLKCGEYLCPYFFPTLCSQSLC